jgi:hypothetical protein
LDRPGNGTPVASSGEAPAGEARAFLLVSGVGDDNNKRSLLLAGNGGVVYEAEERILPDGVVTYALQVTDEPHDIFDLPKTSQAPLPGGAYRGPLWNAVSAAGQYGLPMLLMSEEGGGNVMVLVRGAVVRGFHKYDLVLEEPLGRRYLAAMTFRVGETEARYNLQLAE